jgi:hypothetical protein
MAANAVSATSAAQAPFIYFDGVSCFGQANGAIQIELAAHVLTPDGSGGVKIDLVQTGHVRCNVAAMLCLRDAIDKVLAMLPLGQSEVTSMKH